MIGGPGSGRKRIPSNHDPQSPSDAYKSQQKWWKRRSGSSYYLTAADHAMARRLGHKLKLKSLAEIVRFALSQALSKASK